MLLDGGVTRISFAPTAMKSFRPDGLCAEIPLLRSLLDGRKILERMRDGSLDVDGARVELDRLWNGSNLVDKVLGGVQVRSPKPAYAVVGVIAVAGVAVVASLVRHHHRKVLFS